MGRVGSTVLVCAAVLAVPMSAPAHAATFAAHHGDSQAEARLRASIAKTRAEGSARFKGVISIETPAGDAELRIAGVGELGDNGDARLTMTAGPLLFGKAVSIETRQIHGVVYADYADLLASAQRAFPRSLRGRNWVRIDPKDLGSAAPGGSSSGSSQLDVIRGFTKGSVETLGTETIDGRVTTHYRTEIDLQLAIDRVPKKFRQLLSGDFQALKSTGGKIPTDIWLDAQGRVRRERMRLTITVSGETIHETINFNYVAFGVPVVVKAPPSHDVMSFQDFLDFAKASASTKSA